jgi:2-polyprenyl-3-methyl-5-hydroxy-6-metoxy-1,4-benzoquinol methylase
MRTATVTTETNPTHFESIYVDARGDRTRIPWDDGHASPALVNWMNVVAPGLVRCGGRVAVVGCGLGHDAREVISRGYDVTAFDCSETAIEWARRLDPTNADTYQHVDLFDAPARWRHRFDLVVEVNTIQSLEPGRHDEAMRAIADLVSSHGHLLVICRGAEEEASGDGPPWALTERQLAASAAKSGLVPDGAICSFVDDEDPPVRRLRAVFRRG